MNVFLILLVVSVAGVLAVFWLLKNEEKPSLRNLGVPPAAPPVSVPKPSPLAGLAAKFFPRRIPKNITPEIPSPRVTGLAQKPLEEKPVPKPVEVSAAEEKRIEREIELTSQLEEWKTKYERLDALFKEKSTALEKNEQLLQAELSNRKEFNKVKDILDKELKEARDKARAAQAELTAAKTEGEGYKTKIAQLEEKIARLENAVIAKEEVIADLTKRLEAAAAASVAATLPPPVAAPLPEAPQPPTPPASAPEPVTPPSGELKIEGKTTEITDNQKKEKEGEANA